MYHIFTYFVIEIFSLQVSNPGDIDYGNLFGIVIGVVGLATALIFAYREWDRRGKEKKKYLDKRKRCGEMLLKAREEHKQGYRSIVWLRLDTGMSDDEFYKFYDEFREYCKRLEKEDGQIMIKIEMENLSEFKEQLEKKPNQD